MRVKNQLETQEEAQEETGWKLVHGDVFRAPTNSDLLCVYIGTGVQFLCMTLVTMIFAALGFLSPSNRGGLMTAMLLLWAFMGVFTGYASARLYKMFKGSDWKKITLLTAFMFPGTVFAIFFVLNAIIWGEKSSGAVLFGTMFALVFLWFGISVPLVFVGSYVGFKKPAIEEPVKTNKIPQQIDTRAGLVHESTFLHLDRGHTLWMNLGATHAFNQLPYRICNRTQDSQIKLIDELWELHLPGNPFKNARIAGNGEIKLIVGEVVPKFTISSSLTSVLTSGNAIAVAAAAGSGTVHGAVTSAITQVAVTAVAIASGTCLSTKVDCLWPKVDEQPGSLVLDGVDVTGCPIFNDPQVLKAIEFSRKAHHGQISKVETKSSLVTVPPFSSLCLIRMHSTTVMRTCFCKSPYKTLLVKGTRSPRKMTFL
nr:transmembrane 9 superfamily member 8-like [Ipomoea batatas]